MKRGYQKLFILEIILILLLILNSFIPSILSGYKILILFLILVALLKLLFGFEKDKHRYTKDVIFDLVLILTVSFIIYYISGIFIGFVRGENYYTLYGLKTFIIPIVLGTILKEYLRYHFLMKAEGSKLLLILTIILFILLDFVNVITFKSFSTIYNIFLIICLYILPTIGNNLLCTYLAIKVGYKPNILFLLVIRLYSYLLPITPNINNYVYSLIYLIYPLALLYKFSLAFNKVEDEFITSENNSKNYLLISAVVTFMIVSIYFVSGYFNYYAIVIGSGSMAPSINKGDLVIIEKIKNKELKEGQVIAYNYEGSIVIHRLEHILTTKNEIFYYTKGDANEKTDSWVVTKDMIIGIVNIKIPYIGLPATWMNDL